MTEHKNLYDYKIGDELTEDHVKSLRILKKPVKLMRIGYTYQDSEGTQAEVALVHDDFIEEGEE